jgi:hypothetical protein
MATIRSTINLQTSTLFPTPVTVNIPVNEQVNLDSNFTNVTIAPSSDAIAYTSPSSNTGNVVYFYIQSPLTNSNKVDVYIIDQNDNETLVMVILPGDFAWFPLATYAPGVSVKINNADPINTVVINTFYGERG